MTSDDTHGRTARRFHRSPRTSGPVLPPVAVIGAAGFIGSHLSTTLAEEGFPTTRFQRTSALAPGGRLADGLRRAWVIFFLASSITPALAEKYPERAANDHSFLLNLLRLLRHTDPRPIFVLASSGGTVYDPSANMPYTETAPIWPGTPYGRAKLLLEQELLAHSDLVLPVILRLASVYGPGQRIRGAHGVIAHWLKAMREDRPLQLFGDPRAGRDYVYDDDVVEALIRVSHLVHTLDRGTAEPMTLNIGSAVRTSLLDLLAEVSSVVDRKFTVEFDDARSFDRRDVWLDVTSAARTLNWSPRTSLHQGLRETWTAMLRNESAETIGLELTSELQSRAITHGPLRIDSVTREVHVNDHLVNLSRKEFDFLHLLASHAGKVFSRKEIIRKVWHYESPKSSRTIDTHVNNLRNKLGIRGLIVTVHGVGFRLATCTKGL
jgi:UDP-glucose 4-epimerase